MSTVLDITDFTYNTGTLTIAPGDTTAVFSGTSLASSVKDGDYLFAGGSLAVIQTVTDDTHVDLFTEWAGSSVSAGSYLILKASLLRYHTALIGYDSASFLAMLDGLKLLYGVVDAAPDDSNGEEDQIAIKIDVTPWKAWRKTGGVWVEQAGSPGGPGATILVQNAEPDTSHPNNSLWIDSDSADLDVYALTGSPPAWTDTGMNLKGSTGPASLKPIEAWVTATAYVTGPPASFVSQAGSSYQCLIPHTSGTFSTDLAAGKWGIVAAKGADGTGVGDVVGPASAVDSNLALFDTTSGKAIKDSGKAITDFATAAQGAKADTALQNASAFATAAQGAKADTAVQPGALATVATSGAYADLSGKPSTPTTQRFTSGSGTYTTPAGVTWIEVTLVGGGAGGGGGNNSISATFGGDTTFGTFTAGKGSPAVGGVGGAGGTVGGTGTPNLVAVAGGAGTDGTQSVSGAAVSTGGMGGSSSLGGSGRGAQSSGSGGNAASNSGSGGGGSGATAAASFLIGGGGGGAGATIKTIITSPASTYSYAVGSGGAGAAAGANGGAGGNGAAGIIIVTEHYGS